MKRTLLWIALVFCGVNALLFATSAAGAIAGELQSASTVAAIASAAFGYGAWKSFRSLYPIAQRRHKVTIAASRQGDENQAPNRLLDRSAILSIPADITADGNFDFEIVGESHYQDAISRALPPGRAGKVRAYAIATIDTEDNNEYDSQAVAVRLDHRTVGYLTRDDARQYRRWISMNNMHSPATCRSVIVGTAENGFGIWLDLPIENA